MKRLRILKNQTITFEEGCDRYLDNCRQRNLREGTIKHYKQIFHKFFNYFDPEMPVTDFNELVYNDFVMHLKETMHNDVSINTNLRDLITVLHFFMDEGYIEPFKMKSIKVDQHPVETYSEEELKLLLKKPNIKKCSFTEYQCWVITTFLFCTGVRQRSLIHIQVKDVDFENNIVHVNVTKNRKPLIVPINQTLSNILKEFLKYRQHKSSEDWLFCNVYGQQLIKETCYHMLCSYNKSRGVQTTGIHRYRHTFAKQWMLSGGNVVALSRLLGHSNLSITQNYINLLVSDLSKQVNEINLLDKFSERRSIKMQKI